MSEILFLLIVACVLFTISVLAERRDMNKSVVEYSFFGAVCFLAASFAGVALRVILGEPPILRPDANASEVIKLLKEDPYLNIGFTRFWGVMNWSIAASAGVMYLLSGFVERSVDSKILGIIFFVGLGSGLVIVVGLFLLLEKIALVLGIVATVIGILVGLRSLGKL